MRIFVIVLCVLLVLMCCVQASNRDDYNKINYEVYVTPVMSQHAKLRARNPLLSWLANVLTFGGGQPEDPQLSKPEANCPKCTCGVSLVTSRIVGGIKADINEFPWMAMLLYRGTFYCGGSLISDRYVLTAAHCVLNFKPNQITVKVFDPKKSAMVPRAVEKLYGNERFSLDTFNNDIALVKLQSALDVKDQFVTVCLPTPGKNFGGLEGMVTGWGKLSNGSLSHTLQQVKVPIMTNQQCKKSAYRASRITDNMMCAGYSDGGRDACQGDSGGPLQVGDASEREIVGIVSWGEGCAKPNYPGVYTRVNRYLQWIKNNAKDGCLCDPPASSIDGKTGHCDSLPQNLLPLVAFGSCSIMVSVGDKTNASLEEANGAFEMRPGKDWNVWKAPLVNRGVWTWITTMFGLPIASVFAYRAEARNCQECTCGVNANTSRIIGGKEAPEHKYPWMVALYYKNKFICGGSLINELYVLTAAHCVFNTDRNLFSIKFLLHDRRIPGPESFERRVSYIMTNWFLNALVFITNDVALLKLNETVQLGDFLYPVCLPPEGPTYAGYDAIVTGWGKLADGSFPRKLQELTVPILSYEDCRNQSGYYGFQINDHMLCAGVPEGGKDSCQGDSGGPLHVVDSASGKYIIAGVVSYGFGCARPRYPGIYARVNRFLSWIKFNTRDACQCG
ncbi:transmembrane protease serine 9-like [Topomyia yanbarensis]|uniref:transmembrane protease serine 9-like n=1 Tax=Topomyia yanbarensis TaxID=2498891 RepID=UPI00273C0A0E|nr:transmembrane protease serine 9-like [Topomyia yanbarensis]